MSPKAALKLHVSPRKPGISRQIHDLEDEIGFQRSQRSAKSVRLTPAGTVFLSEARAVLQRVSEAVAKARAADGAASGEISIGYAPSLTVQILPPALRKFQEQFPKVRVSIAAPRFIHRGNAGANRRLMDKFAGRAHRNPNRRQNYCAASTLRNWRGMGCAWRWRQKHAAL